MDRRISKLRLIKRLCIFYALIIHKNTKDVLIFERVF